MMLNVLHAGGSNQIKNNHLLFVINTSKNYKLMLILLNIYSPKRFLNTFWEYSEYGQG